MIHFFEFSNEISFILNKLLDENTSIGKRAALITVMENGWAENNIIVYNNCTVNLYYLLDTKVLEKFNLEPFTSQTDRMWRTTNMITALTVSMLFHVSVSIHLKGMYHQ